MVAVAGTIMILGGIGAIAINQTLLPKLAANSVTADWSWIKQSAERTTIVNKTEEVVVRPDNAMRTAVSNVRPMVVQIVVKSVGAKSAQIGTGIILASDGIVAAQLPVVGAVAKGATFEILMTSGKSHEATLEAVDSLTGVAFLRMADVTNLPVVTFMRGEDIFLTQAVVAISATDAQNSRATVGRVTDIGYDRALSVTQTLSSDQLAPSVRVDLTPSVATGDVLFSSRSEFVGLAVRDDKAVRVVAVDAIGDAWQRLLADKLSAQTALGLEYIWLSPSVVAVRDIKFAQKDNAQIGGALVTTVAKGSAAARAKVYAGDVIVAVGDVAIDNSLQLAWILRNYQRGDVARLKIIRSGQEKQLLVSL